MTFLMKNTKSFVNKQFFCGAFDDLIKKGIVYSFFSLFNLLYSFIVTSMKMNFFCFFISPKIIDNYFPVCIPLFEKTTNTIIIICICL